MHYCRILYWLIISQGVTEAEREAFELLPDDERQCAICKTTCFNSALTAVDGKHNEIVCLRHFKAMECEPDKLILRYRYTLDELATLLGGLKARAECYDFWVDKTKKALEAKGDDREELETLKEMLEEAKERKYPETELLEALQVTVEEAEKCQTVANQLGNKKVSKENYKKKLQRPNFFSLSHPHVDLGCSFICNFYLCVPVSPSLFSFGKFVSREGSFYPCVYPAAS